MFKALYNNLGPSYHTQEISRVLKQLFFIRPADRTGRESTTSTFQMITGSPACSGHVWFTSIYLLYSDRKKYKMWQR